MKITLLKYSTILLTFIFLSHIAGIRISEHKCFDCGTSHLEIGGYFHTLHLIISLNKDNHCCDPFHHQHKNHSQSCSNRFLGYSIPFKSIEPIKVQHCNPGILLSQEIKLFHSVLAKWYINPAIIAYPERENILLKTCQFLS